MVAKVAADVLHEVFTGLEKPNQWYTLTRTYKLAEGQRIRVRIEHDNHDEQSRNVAEFWTATNGWVNVVAIPGLSLESRSMASTYLPVDKRNREIKSSLNAMAARLLRDAVAVVVD